MKQESAEVAEIFMSRHKGQFRRLDAPTERSKKVRIQFRGGKHGQWRPCSGFLWEAYDLREARQLVAWATQFPARGERNTEFRIVAVGEQTYFLGPNGLSAVNEQTTNERTR